ncbi:uncharacterized protein METZ01_LOCUS248856, partial [marine metagenome]
MKIFFWGPFFLTLVIAQDNSLFFSEYAEGSSNNKYLEIYNGTGSTINLDNYAFPSASNDVTTPGVYEYWNSFTSGATIASGDVYIIAHPQADASILDSADQTHQYLSNGNDGYAIVMGNESSYSVIDWIGNWDANPGDGGGWDVAGVTNGTMDHTLVRKSTVTSGNTDWSTSAGTTTDNSEWIVLDEDTWTYLGSHPHPGLETNNPVISITSPTDGATLYSSDVTVSFTVSNFTVAASGGDGHIHYSLDGGSTVMQYTVDDIELTGLSAIDHSFIIWLVDDNHTNLNPYVADTVAFTVEEESDDITLIYDIQSGSFTDGTPVTIRGVVTAGTGETPDGSGLSIYIQDGQGQYSGINVYAPDNTVSRGDSIEVVGTTKEYYGKTEIENVTSITVLATGVSLPDPEILTLDQSDWEPWEGVLIQIQSVTVSNDDAGYGE